MSNSDNETPFRSDPPRQLDIVINDTVTAISEGIYDERENCSFPPKQAAALRLHLKSFALAIKEELKAEVAKELLVAITKHKKVQSNSNQEDESSRN